MISSSLLTCCASLVCMAPLIEARAAPEKPHLVVFAGSARKDSLNKKLAQEAAKRAVAQGAQVTFLDLADYPMPLYNGDLEEKEGLPEAAKKLKALFNTAHGFLIVTPEYNSSLTPLVVNTIAWVSRPLEGDEEPLLPFKGKVAGIASASPGAGGGARGLKPLRMLLEGMRMSVVEPECIVGKADGKFDAQGHLLDEEAHTALNRVVESLIQAAQLKTEELKKDS